MEKNEEACRTNTRLSLKKILQQVSVEPTMFLYMMAFMLTNVIESAFFVYKACHVDHGYSDEICRNIKDPAHKDINTEVQKTVSTFHQWEGISGHVFPAILALFLGAWSDKRGRKLPLIIGLTGKFIYSVMIVVNASQPTWPLNYVIYTAVIPSAMTGADVAIFGCCFAYISDISSVKNRTFRITILDIAYLSTMPTGIAIGAQLFKLFDGSFAWMFVVNASLLFLAIVYSLIRLEWQTTDAQVPISEVGYRNIFTDFFDKKHLISSIKSITKRRPENRRGFLWLLFIGMGFYTFQRDERQMLYLYTQLKLNWDAHMFSWFRTYQSSAYVFSILIGIPIMVKLLKWPDTVIVMIGSISHAAGRVFFAIANSSVYMFLGATVASLGPVTPPVIRSMVSKLIPGSERGTIFAVLAVFDNAVPLISAVMYSQLYNATLHVYPASIIWLTIASQAIVFILISCIHVKLSGPLQPAPDQTDPNRSLVNETENSSNTDHASNEDVREVSPNVNIK